MRRRLTEETVLFFSVVKWTVLAAAVGAVAGLGTTLFLKALDLALALQARHRDYFLLLPLALPLVAWLGYRVAPKSDVHSTDKVIEAIHGSAPVGIGSLVKAFILPVLTIGAGGSAGKEAPCADVGAGAGSLIGDLLGFDAADRRKLMICGVSAGFASVFGVPIAGAIFGVEVLFVGGILYDVLLPSFIAGITACQVSLALGVHYFSGPLAFVPAFSKAFFLKVIIAGVVFGLCSALFVEAGRVSRKWSSRLGMSLPVKAFFAGCALALLALATSPAFLGLGLDTIQHALEGQGSGWYAPLLKTIATAITLGFGGIGGIITPIFFVGATTGSALSGLLGTPPATLAAIGFVSLLAGAANTPISASIMAIELFGPAIAPYAALSCVVSFLMTGHRSVFPSQVLTVRKSGSLEVELGKELGGASATFAGRGKGILSRLLRLVRRRQS